MRHSLSLLPLLVCLSACDRQRGGSTADSPAERSDLVTLKGNPVILLGPALKVGQQAPAFRAVNGSFEPVSLADFAGKTVLISAVPSLDTPVCSSQTVRFNEEAAKLGDDIVIVTISMDLPFAQQRFCLDQKVAGLQVLSDSVWREFGRHYGLLIKDMGLLARAVMVVDRAGILRHYELVSEIASHPDYDAVLKALAEAAK
jgi:thioredoxin-dependent peroxiredoxin